MQLAVLLAQMPDPYCFKIVCLARRNTGVKLPTPSQVNTVGRTYQGNEAFTAPNTPLVCFSYELL